MDERAAILGFGVYGLVAGLCLATMVSSCSQGSYVTTPNYAEVAEVTTAGHTVFVQAELAEHYPDTVKHLLDLVRLAKTPLEMEPHVLSKDSFPTKASPVTGYAFGQVNLRTGKMWLTLRVRPSMVYLPTLKHEIDHYLAQDPNAGHRMLPCECIRVGDWVVIPGDGP